MASVRTSLVFVVLLACVSCTSTQTAVPASPPAGSSLVAFVNAAVIPMDQERVLRDQTVLIADGRIAEIGPAASVKVPADAVRIDATGRYLLPALCDMHVHVEGESWNALFTPEVQAMSKDAPFGDFLFPYVANGVTTVQVLSGTPELLVLRQEIERGTVLAPRMILARMIDGPDKAWPQPLSVWVRSGSEASDAVRRAKADGYDKMKVYSFLSQESYDAVIATSKEQQMDVIGHIPMALSVEYVVKAGQKMIAHTEEVAKHNHGNYTAERVDYFAKVIADGRVWMTPTLVTTRKILEQLDHPDELRAASDSVYMNHPMQQQIWTFISQNLIRPIPEGARARLKADFEQFQRPLTKAFHDKGGQLMTGTDSLFPRLVPGFAIHRELRELVDVGLTPYQALRASTTIPYEYLGEASRAGTIRVGQHSDLLLVDGNPLEDISAASKIAGVFMRGRWISKAEIDKTMNAIAEKSAHAH